MNHIPFAIYTGFSSNPFHAVVRSSLMEFQKDVQLFLGDSWVVKTQNVHEGTRWQETEIYLAKLNENEEIYFDLGSKELSDTWEMIHKMLKTIDSKYYVGLQNYRHFVLRKQTC